MPINDPASLLSLAQEAVDLAAEHFKTHRPSEVRDKDDRDVVTELDFEIEAMVRSFLRERTPEIGFLGEENGHVGNRETYWVLDPIDGTANFIHGLPLCGIILGLIQGDNTILGVIDLPFLELRYHAVERGGAYRNGEPIKVSSATKLSKSMISTSGYGHGAERQESNELTHALQKRLTEAQRVRGLGSVAVELAWVAEGRLDAHVKLGNKPWDTAAGVLIAREAGAVVLDSNGTEHTIHSRCVLATTPGLKQELLSVFEEARGTKYWQNI